MIRRALLCSDDPTNTPHIWRYVRRRARPGREYGEWHKSTGPLRSVVVAQASQSTHSQSASVCVDWWIQTTSVPSIQFHFYFLFYFFCCIFHTPRRSSAEQFFFFLWIQKTNETATIQNWTNIFRTEATRLNDSSWLRRISIFFFVAVAFNFLFFFVFSFSRLLIQWTLEHLESVQ